jgi:hypothetical protein
MHLVKYINNTNPKRKLNFLLSFHKIMVFMVFYGYSVWKSIGLFSDDRLNFIQKS